MTLSVLVIAEDVLGMTLARDLADRVVIERGPAWAADIWSDPELVATQRCWSGLKQSTPWTKWTQLKKMAEQHAIHAHGLGLTGHGVVAHKAARITARVDPQPDMLVLCIDSDGDPALRDDLQQGLDRVIGADVPCVLAVAHQESEAWVVAGFVPQGADEEAALLRLATEHRFDPTAAPHRLTAKRPTDPHDAKRVCEALFGAEGTRSERARRCWTDAPLADLEHRGEHTGLPEYLRDVGAVLVRLLGGVQPRTPDER